MKLKIEIFKEIHIIFKRIGIKSASEVSVFLNRRHDLDLGSQSRIINRHLPTSDINIDNHFIFKAFSIILSPSKTFSSSFLGATNCNATGASTNFSGL